MQHAHPMHVIKVTHAASSKTEIIDHCWERDMSFVFLLLLFSSHVLDAVTLDMQKLVEL